MPELERHFTVYAVDRRGRGGSGDAPTYAVEREFEDVAAVVDSLEGERSPCWPLLRRPLRAGGGAARPRILPNWFSMSRRLSMVAPASRRALSMNSMISSPRASGTS